MIDRIPRWLPAVAAVACVGALVAWSAWERWQLLAETPFPVGVDGYYYPLQLRALLESGSLAYPAPPLAFWLMAPLAAVTDPIVGAKLGAAVGGAAIAFPAYALGARLGKSRAAGLVAAALATVSAGSAYLTIEFVKNGIGLTVALTALVFALRAIERPTRARVAIAIAAIVAAWATHKMGAAVAAIAVPAAIAEAIGRGALRGRRLIYVVLALTLTGIVALAIGLAAPQRFLSPDDLALVRGLFTATERWDLPVLEVPALTITLGDEPAIAAILGIVAAVVVAAQHVAKQRPPDLGPRPRGPRLVVARYEWSRIARSFGDLARSVGLPQLALPHAPGERVAAWAIVGLALAIALPWLAVDDPQGLGFRLRIAAFVPMALCGGIVAGSLVAAVAGPLRRRSTATTRPIDDLIALAPSTALVGVALVLAMRMPGDRTEGRVLTHPALVTAALALDGRVPSGDTIVVPERHIAFMVAWYARLPVSLRPESIPPAHRWRLMPLAFIQAGSPLDDALIAARREPGLVPPLGVHPRHPNGLVLVAEPTWAWILDHVPPAERDRLIAWPTI